MKLRSIQKDAQFFYHRPPSRQESAREFMREALLRTMVTPQSIKLFRKYEEGLLEHEKDLPDYEREYRGYVLKFVDDLIALALKSGLASGHLAQIEFLTSQRYVMSTMSRLEDLAEIVDVLDGGRDVMEEAKRHAELALKDANSGSRDVRVFWDALWSEVKVIMKRNKVRVINV